jgi:hypothetical protein
MICALPQLHENVVQRPLGPFREDVKIPSQNVPVHFFLQGGEPDRDDNLNLERDA